MNCNWILFIQIFALILSIINANRISSAIRDEVDRFKSYIQRSSNPCNDIYSYSCGNYVKNVHDTYDGYLKSVPDILSGKFNSQVKQLLVDHHNETNAFERKAILFYRTCRESVKNKTKIRHQLNDFIRSLSVGGGWPIWQDTWNYGLFDWFKVLANMKLYGVAPLIDGRIAPFPYNTSGKNFVISCKPKFGYKLNKDKQSESQYEEDLRHIFMDYGARRGEAKEYAREVLEFEKGLQWALDNLTQYNNENDNNFEDYHYQRFKSDFWGVDWDYYFETVFGFQKLRSTYILSVEGASNLRIVLKYMSHSQPTVIAKFLLASIAMETYELANPTDKPNFCVKILSDAMNPVISYMYLHKHFDEKSEIDIHDMMKTLKMAYLQIWNQQTIDKDAILNIKIKLDNMRLVFFSDHIDVIESAAHTYTGIDIDRWNFVRTYFKFIRHNNLLDIPKDYVRYMIMMSGNRKEPFYVKEKNAVVIPPAVMQTPYYNYSWPKLFKYSKLGFLISRTMAQAFDSIGRKLDQHGSRHDWWMTRTDVNLQIERKLIMKYDEFRYNGKQINGTITLRENWSDLFGIKGAFQGYQNKLLGRRHSDPIESIPRTGLSSNQTFFVSYAQIFCEEHLPYDIEDIDDSKTQVPPKLRVVGPLSLIDEFRYSFNCI